MENDASHTYRSFSQDPSDPRTWSHQRHRKEPSGSGSQYNSNPEVSYSTNPPAFMNPLTPSYDSGPSAGPSLFSHHGAVQTAGPSRRLLPAPPRLPYDFPASLAPTGLPYGLSNVGGHSWGPPPAHMQEAPWMTPQPPISPPASSSRRRSEKEQLILDIKADLTDILRSRSTRKHGFTAFAVTKSGRFKLCRKGSGPPYSWDSSIPYVQPGEFRLGLVQSLAYFDDRSSIDDAARNLALSFGKESSQDFPTLLRAALDAFILEEANVGEGSVPEAAEGNSLTRKAWQVNTTLAIVQDEYVNITNQFGKRPVWSLVFVQTERIPGSASGTLTALQVTRGNIPGSAEGSDWIKFPGMSLPSSGGTHGSPAGSSAQPRTMTTDEILSFEAFSRRQNYGDTYTMDSPEPDG